MDKRIGYEAIKRRKRRRRINAAMTIIVLLLVTSLTIFVIHERDKIVSPAVNFINDLKRAYSNTDKGGFPVTLPGSNEYKIEPYGDGFTLLTDTYLHIYGSDGALLKSYRHGFKNPQTAYCGDGAQGGILLYDKNYYKFALINAKENIYEKHSADGRQSISEAGGIETENGDKIMLAALGADDTAAVVTNNVQYSSVIDVYNKSRDKLVYRKRFVNENVLALTFSPDAKYLYAAAAGFQNGDAVCMLYQLKLDTEDDFEWEKLIDVNAIPVALYNTGGIIYCVTDIGVYGYAGTGAFTGKYNWEGGLKDYSFDTDTGASAYIISSYVTGKFDLESIDKNCRLSAKLSATDTAAGDNPAGDGISQATLRVAKSGVYLLSGSQLLRYDFSLKEHRRETLDEEYASLAVTARALYLLGFNTCAMVKL